MGIILSTLLGCGKEELFAEYDGKAKLLDMTNENIISELPPKEFVDDVMFNVDKYDIVFVPTTPFLLEEFNRRNIDYDIFYPSKDRRQEIVIKLVGTRMPFKAIAKVDNNFSKWIDEIDAIESDNCHKHKMLKKGQYINNDELITEYLTNLKNNSIEDDKL